MALELDFLSISILISIIFLIARIIRLDEQSLFTITFEALSGIFMAIALFFVLFPVNPLQSTTTITTNVPLNCAYNAGNTSATLPTILKCGTTNETQTSNSITYANPNIGNVGTILIVMFFSIYLVFISVMLLIDIPPVFFPMRYPKMKLGR
jgi:hypothetical protein